MLMLHAAALLRRAACHADALFIFRCFHYFACRRASLLFRDCQLMPYYFADTLMPLFFADDVTLPAMLLICRRFQRLRLLMPPAFTLMPPCHAMLRYARLCYDICFAAMMLPPLRDAAAMPLHAISARCC